MPSSSRSKARAIVFVSTPTSCPSTCARKPSSHRHRRHDAAVAHQERPQPITTTADHQKPPTRQNREFWKPTIAETSVPVDRYMDHDGVDLIALASVLRAGLSRGGS